MKKRDSKHSAVSANTELQSPGGGPVYDIPQWNIIQDNELHVETNKAYGQIKLRHCDDNCNKTMFLV